MTLDWLEDPVKSVGNLNPLQAGNAEWLKERCGYLTASVAWKAFDRLKKGGFSQKYYDLMNDIITERATGMNTSIFVTEDMKHGQETEAVARDAFQELTGEGIELVGFVKHPHVAWLGASPDFLINDGIGEIKCPSTSVHLQRVFQMLNGDDWIPQNYKIQMQVQMLCTGRKWGYFIDFDDRLIDEYADYRMIKTIYEPTQEELDATLEGCVNFLKAVGDRMEMLK